MGGWDWWGPGPQSVDPCRRHDVSCNLNGFDRLGLGHTGRNGKGMESLVLLQRTVSGGEWERHWLGLWRNSPGRTIRYKRSLLTLTLLWRLERTTERKLDADQNGMEWFHYTNFVVKGPYNVSNVYNSLIQLQRVSNDAICGVQGWQERREGSRLSHPNSIGDPSDLKLVERSIKTDPSDTWTRGSLGAQTLTILLFFYL